MAAATAAAAAGRAAAERERDEARRSVSEAAAARQSCEEKLIELSNEGLAQRREKAAKYVCDQLKEVQAKLKAAQAESKPPAEAPP